MDPPLTPSKRSSGNETSQAGGGEMVVRAYYWCVKRMGDYLGLPIRQKYSMH